MFVTEGDVQEIVRPLCTICNVNLASKAGKKPGKFRKKCTRCSRKYEGTYAPWRKYKKSYCENPECTATGLISNQLDVDHIDGDKTNNDPSNLMTLCKNCHALKTYLNRDFVTLAHRRVVK